MLTILKHTYYFEKTKTKTKTPSSGLLTFSTYTFKEKQSIKKAKMLYLDYLIRRKRIK